MNLCHHIWKCCFYNEFWFIYITGISIKNYNKKLEILLMNGQKIAIFGIIVQIAGLIYGIVNKANDIVFMCLIFLFISTVSVFDKNENLVIHDVSSFSVWLKHHPLKRRNMFAFLAAAVTLFGLPLGLGIIFLCILCY